jgi:hypothetical protein
VALVPIELGALAVTQTLEVADTDVQDEISATHVETSWPVGVDLLEIEDDEGVSEVVPRGTRLVTEARDGGFDNPLVIHLDDFDRPPRA